MEIKDGTLGGYMSLHERPPAFEGKDGLSYSVDIQCDYLDDARFGTSLVYVRWSSSGEEPVGHLETDYLFTEPDADAARTAIGTLLLEDVKSHLDRLIDEKEEVGDW